MRHRGLFIQFLVRLLHTKQRFASPSGHEGVPKRLRAAWPGARRGGVIPLVVCALALRAPRISSQLNEIKSSSPDGGKFFSLSANRAITTYSGRVFRQRKADTVEYLLRMTRRRYRYRYRYRRSCCCSCRFSFSFSFGFDFSFALGFRCWSQARRFAFRSVSTTKFYATARK